MGFWVMLVLFLGGLGHLIFSIKKRAKGSIYYLPMVVGVLMIIVALVMASPDGSQKILEFMQ